MWARMMEKYVALTRLILDRKPYNLKQNSYGYAKDPLLFLSQVTLVLIVHKTSEPEGLSTVGIKNNWIYKSLTSDNKENKKQQNSPKVDVLS